MEYNIALSGTFDVENYGDLLFPEIFKRAMEKRGLNFNLFLFSPFECDGNTTGSLTGRVYSPEDMEKIHAEHPFDAVVIGGGALIRFDQIPVKRPGDTEISYYHIPDSWIYPSAFAIKNNIKLIYNLPQVPYEIDGAFAELTHYLLRNTDYISVRDKISEKHIADSYNGEEVPEISVHPDSVCCISELIPESQLPETAEIFDIKKPYAVIHINASKPEKDDVYLEKIIKNLISKGLQPVLLPLDYTYLDDVFMSEFNRKTGGMCKTFGRKLTIIEMASVLANCEMYIGSSFHGAITAMAYGKKALSYNCIHPYKNREIFKQFGVEKYVAENGEQLNLLADELLNDDNFNPNVAAVTKEVNEHFDRIFNIITQPETAEKSERDNADYIYNISPDLLRKVFDDESLHRELARLINENNDLRCRADHLKEIEDTAKIEDLIKRKDNNIQVLNERCTKLSSQLEKYAIQNQAFLSSRYWKITKPMRVFTGGIKKVMNRFKFTRNILKALSILFSSGPLGLARRLMGRTNSSAKLKISNKITAEQRRIEETTEFAHNVKFSIVVPLYNTPINFLKEMIDSVKNQTYKNWELCLADGSDAEHTDVEKCAREYAAADKRIVYKKLEKNLGISENTNACIKMATGDYIALFDHDDVLHPSALYCYACEIENGADFIYCDEDKFESLNKGFFAPYFKPDFSPDMLCANNYICHFTVFDRKLIDKVGMFRSDFDGSQDHDFILRLTEQAKKIVHIPKLLYHWRVSSASVASDPGAKPYTVKAGIKAVSEHLNRIGLCGTVESSPFHPNFYRLRYTIKGEPLISILIPSCNHTDDLDKCIKSIENLSTYRNFEIIVIENNSNSETFEYYKTLEQYENVSVVVYKTDTFNYSAINNFGAQFASGEYLLLLNNDIEVISPSWLEEMLMFAQRPDVGAVGAKLYYPDDTIQHAGVVVGLGGVAGHSFVHNSRSSVGYFGRCAMQQNISAVTAACIMVPRRVWDQINGLDESFAVAFNDIDMCMRIRKAGYLICFTPYAELYHYESKSRGLDDVDPVKAKRFNGEVLHFKEVWQNELIAGDPYYNKNLTLIGQSFTPKTSAEIKADIKREKSV